MQTVLISWSEGMYSAVQCVEEMLRSVKKRISTERFHEQLLVFRLDLQVEAVQDGADTKTHAFLQRYAHEQTGIHVQHIDELILGAPAGVDLHC